MTSSKTHQNSKKNDSGDTSIQNYIKLHCLPKYAIILPNGDIVDKFRTSVVANVERKRLQKYYDKELKIIELEN